MSRFKKLRKLRENPRRFVYDAVLKRRPDVAAHMARRTPELKRPCRHRFSVVSAVYNVERYLEDFFRSMDQQTVSLDHIELILVDDGSTDSSPGIIERWRQRYPGSVRYFRKENGGQASARNLGLEHVSGEWVTFIDPDDFVHHRYFEEVDRFLFESRRYKPGLACCKWVFFHEATERYAHNHPLNYRFAEGSTVVRARERDFMASSAATSFYRADVLREHAIRFDEHIRPNFEDGHFSGQYLLAIGAHRYVAFVADAHYYYRKREAGTSTLDSSWADPRRFDVVVERGYIGLLDEAQRQLGHVPLAVQRLVLYDLFWYLKRIVADEASVSFLTPEQRSAFVDKVERVFEHIDRATIINFSLAGCWWMHRVGMLGRFKGEPAPYYVVYARRYEKTKRLVRLAYFFTGERPVEQILVDGEEVVPHFAKELHHEFLGSEFVNERLLWVRLETPTSQLSLRIAGEDARLHLGGEQQPSLTRDAIEAFHHDKPKPNRGRRQELLVRLARSPLVQRRYANAWMLIDRDSQADDNAEHLTRWILQNRPDINAFFVLRRSSHDWDRLHREDFPLVAYGSLEHRLLLLNARHVVSSHPDAFVLNFLHAGKYRDALSFDFTFLQHGVIRDDISRWLNRKNIDLFVTSSPAEHESVAGDTSRYKFPRLQTKMLGLARHDALLTRSEPTERVLLIMPTWRQWLVGTTSRQSTARAESSAFYESTYAQRWKELIHSDALRDLAREHDYEVVFFPHANMQLYIDWFDAPSWVQVRTHATDPVLHKLFRRAAMLVTDYSSVFFEVGLLDKPVLYYQFDYDEMYGGKHPSRAGYFDFERDGFGPVTRELPELLDEIAKVLRNDAKPSQEYLQRMHETLPLRDARNRERTVTAIERLEHPEPSQDQRAEIEVQLARTTSRHGAWELAAARWARIAARDGSPAEAEDRLAEARERIAPSATSHTDDAGARAAAPLSED